MYEIKIRLISALLLAAVSPAAQDKKPLPWLMRVNTKRSTIRTKNTQVELHPGIKCAECSSAYN